MARSNPIVSRWAKRSRSPTIQQSPKAKRVKQSSPGDSDRSPPSVNIRQQQNTAGGQQTLAIKSFPFFKLPLELRNVVYETIAETIQTIVLYLIDGQILDESNLLIAGPSDREESDPSYHDEYRPILLKRIATIETEVVDFDFRRIVTFLSSLKPNELSTLSARTLHIDLEITEKLDQPESNRLWCWLKHLAHTSKKGSSLDIQYSLRGRYVKNIQTHPPVRDLHLHPRSIFTYPTLYQWAEQLDRLLEHVKPGTRRDEALKIRQLFDGLV